MEIEEQCEGLVFDMVVGNSKGFKLAQSLELCP